MGRIDSVLIIPPYQINLTILLIFFLNSLKFYITFLSCLKTIIKAKICLRRDSGGGVVTKAAPLRVIYCRAEAISLETVCI